MRMDLIKLKENVTQLTLCLIAIFTVNVGTL